jgi:tetratricopeptide (TPR) repeat protein
MELGDVVRLQGEYGLALKLTQRALAILREIGDTLEAARAAAHLGRLYSYLGDYTRAQDCFAQVVHGASMLDSPEMVVEGLLPLAMFVLHHGDAGQALAHAERAWQLGRVYSSPYMQAHALVVLAHAQAVNGRQDAAATYQQALERYEALGSPALAVEPLAALATVVIDRGDQTGALAHVEVVLKVLADHPRAGMDEPFGVYLRCYRILTANGDPRAIAVLNNAHVLLEAYASEIGDAAPRQSFLENVASHREIMQAWSALPRGREAAEYHEL